MRETNRRKSLKQTGVGIAVSVASVSQAANERIVIGVVGCGFLGSVAAVNHRAFPGQGSA